LNVDSVKGLSWIC